MPYCLDGPMTALIVDSFAGHIVYCDYCSRNQRVIGEYPRVDNRYAIRSIAPRAIPEGRRVGTEVPQRRPGSFGGFRPPVSGYKHFLKSMVGGSEKFAR